MYVRLENIAKGLCRQLKENYTVFFFTILRLFSAFESLANIQAPREVINGKASCIIIVAVKAQ